MLSNQVLQRAVSEMEAIAGGACSVWSLDGYRIVLSGSESEGTAERVKRFLKDVKEDAGGFWKAHSCSERVPGFRLGFHAFFCRCLSG